MRLINRLGRSRLLAAVAGAAAASVSGIALAQVPDKGGTIHGCYAKAGGALRILDPTDVKSRCTPDEDAVAWNQTGPPGPAGRQGPTGQQGPPGPRGEVPATLPVGRTERGLWSLTVVPGVGGDHFATEAVAFPEPLAPQPLRTEVIEPWEQSAHCPGTAADPKATPGLLCLYQSSDDANTHLLIIPDRVSTSGGLGFVVQAKDNLAPPNAYFLATGTWAVTAACCLPRLTAQTATLPPLTGAPAG